MICLHGSKSDARGTALDAFCVVPDLGPLSTQLGPSTAGSHTLLALYGALCCLLG